jgi:hypothetical protein
MATQTIKIEPSPALEQMLKRLAAEAVREAQAGEVARLKTEIKALAESLSRVPTPFGPLGDSIAARLDEITDALRLLAK